MFSHLLAATSKGNAGRGQMFAGVLSNEQLRKQEEAADERWWMIVGDNGPEI